MNNVVEQAARVEDCQDRESKLNEWECGFIEDMDVLLAKGTTLTPRQDAVLEKLWDRVTNG